MALQHDKRILPLLMREMENDNVCKALRKFFADVRYVTPNKVNKQDSTAAPTDFLLQYRLKYRNADLLRVSAVDVTSSSTFVVGLTCTSRRMFAVSCGHIRVRYLRLHSDLVKEGFQRTDRHLQEKLKIM